MHPALLTCTVLFIYGIISAELFRCFPITVILLYILVLLLLWYLINVTRAGNQNEKYNHHLLFSIAILCSVTGFSYMIYVSSIKHNDISKYATGDKYIVEGMLDEPARYASNKVTSNVKALKIMVGEKEVSVAGRLKVTVYDPELILNYGDIIKVTGRLKIIRGFKNPGIFDYSKRAFVIDENAVYRQNYTPVFEWLNKNTEKDSVVYANSDLSRLIPVYTANNVFYVREANLFFISDKEVLDRFILNNFFSAFGKDFIIENDRSVYGVRYIDAYGHTVQANKLRRLLGLKTEPEVYLPEEAIQKVIGRAAELQKGNFVEEIKNYRIDYLIWDKNKNPDWEVNSKNFKPIFLSGDLIIFKSAYLSL